MTTTTTAPRTSTSAPKTFADWSRDFDAGLRAYRAARNARNGELQQMSDELRNCPRQASSWLQRMEEDAIRSRYANTPAHAAMASAASDLHNHTLPSLTVSDIPAALAFRQHCGLHGAARPGSLGRAAERTGTDDTDRHALSGVLAELEKQLRDLAGKEGSGLLRWDQVDDHIRVFTIDGQRVALLAVGGLRGRPDLMRQVQDVALLEHYGDRYLVLPDVDPDHPERLPAWYCFDDMLSETATWVERFASRRRAEEAEAARKKAVEARGRTLEGLHERVLALEATVAGLVARS
jgi:hypothetical protein